MNLRNPFTTLSTKFMTRQWWEQVLFISLASFLFIELSAFLGIKIFVPLVGWGDGIAAVDDSILDSLESLLARWDSGYYLQIVQNGYRVDGTEKAFFPLYPVLIRFLGDVTGISYLWSGLIISLLSLIIACLFMYKWVLIDYREEIALYSVIWMCIFPTAFFFAAIYAEALFLLMSITSVYFARRGQFVASGIAIALAGATRPSALLLAIPYIFEFLQQRNYGKIHLSKFILGGIIAPIGMLGYLSYLGFEAGGFELIKLYTSIQSTEWKRSISWPWITFYNGLRAVFLGTDIKPDWFSRILVVQDFTYAVFGLIMSLWSLLNLRLSIALFLILSMLFIFANHGPYGYAFWSVPRYVAALFPFYLILALFTLRLPNRFKLFPILLSLVLLSILSAWFATGRWVA